MSEIRDEISCKIAESDIPVWQ